MITAAGHCPRCDNQVHLNKKQPCKFMFHNEVCPHCDFCKDCMKYATEVEEYNRTISDPEYFFEPWDAGDTPEAHRPKPPIERYTVFTSGSHKLLEVSNPVYQTSQDGSFALISLTARFESDVSTPIGGGLRLSGYETFEVPFSWIYRTAEESVSSSVEAHMNEFWKHVIGCYTPAALEAFYEELQLTYIKPKLAEVKGTK